MIYTCKIDSPVGLLTAASDGTSITGLWIEGQKYYGKTLKEDAVEQMQPIFVRVKEWLHDYFAGKNPEVDFPLAPDGSPFRQKVFQALMAIPYGQVTTYGAIAKGMNQEKGSMSAQAVGGAVGHNPISIIIPCHRVVGADGSLTGYAGGIENKVALLKLENVALEGMYIPKIGTAL